MSAVRLSHLAAVTAGKLYGEDLLFDSVSTDSRSLRRGQLFVALKGPNFDGNLYVEEAAAKGAAGALVQRRTECVLPQVEVDDTRRALGDYARSWRQNFDIPLVAVTGSNGKTTIKEMAASILRQRGPVLATRGNLNNEIGVPLSLLEIGQESIAAVIELGANHPGEIDYLARIALPTVGVVSNAGPAHLEGFGSLEGVARAKGELFAALGPADVAVYNADDRFAELWVELIGRRQKLSFGIEEQADFSAGEIDQRMTAAGIETQFRMHCVAGDCDVRLPFAGQHNVRNALAAAAAAWSAGASLDDIREGLQATSAVAGRLQIRTGYHGSIILDDTYNANPGSLKAALAVQKTMPGEAWLVLGDMGELGDGASQRHAEVGEYARAQGVRRLLASGGLTQAAVDAFGPGASWYPDIESLIAALTAEAGAGVTVLVKASRAMRFERVVDALVANAGQTPRRANGG